MNRLISLFAVVVLGAGCAAPTRAALIRSSAEGRILGCLYGARYASQRMECLAQNERYCREQKLEQGCGLDNLYVPHSRAGM